MNLIKGALVFLAALTLILSASAQDAFSCDGTGKYCFSDSVYDCVDGVPTQVEYCKGVCDAGRCIDKTLAPAVSRHVDAKPLEAARGSDWIPFIILAIIAVAILFFSLQMVKAKKRAER